MVQRFVSVGDDFTLPPAVLGPLNATILDQASGAMFSVADGLPHFSYLNSYGMAGGVAKHYPLIVAEAHGGTYSSRSYNGDQMQDTALAAVGTTARTWTPSGGLVMVSNPINDVGHQQGDAQGLDGYKLSLESLIAVLRASGRIHHAGFTFSAGWNADPYADATLSGGSVRTTASANAAGETATATFTGAASHYMTYAKIGADGAVQTVTLDGVDIATLNTSNRGRATNNNPGITWLPVVVALPPMDAGTHTLVVTCVSGAPLSGVLLMAPTTPPIISIEKAPKPLDGAYVSFYGAGTVDRYRQTFNDAIDEVVAKFPNDGFILTSRPDSGWRAEYLQADGLHPNDLGMKRESAAVMAALGDMPIYA